MIRKLREFWYAICQFILLMNIFMGGLLLAMIAHQQIVALGIDLGWFLTPLVQWSGWFGLIYFISSHIFSLMHAVNEKYREDKDYRKLNIRITRDEYIDWLMKKDDRTNP